MITPTVPVNDEKAQEIIRDFGELSGQRGVWESHWQEIAERVWPNYSWGFNPYWYTTPGQKKTEFLFDSTAALGLDRFAAILDSLLTPRDQKWHRLQADNADLMKNRAIQLYFEDINNILFKYRYLPQANFPAQNQMNYKAMGAFGTGIMFTDELDGGIGLRYKSCSLGECYIRQNHQGIVDTVFRFFAYTARQAVQHWGEDKVGDQIREAYKAGKQQQFHFIHMVEPRADFDPGRKDAKGKKWASYYVCKEDERIIEEGGYHSFPYSVGRDQQAYNETYGRSRAMDLLPAIKTLNEEKKTILKAGHRAVDPILLAHDDGVLDGFSLKPGAINYGGVNSQGQVMVHALPTGNLQIGKELMDDERSLINDGFLVNLFQILTENPQMTATEVLERTREKGILLAPTVGRQQSEYLGPMVIRELDILSRQGLLPPMPPLLKEAQGEYKIVYDSPMSKAQRAEEAAGLARTIEQFLTVVNVTQDPTPLDHFDWDKIVPAVADINSVPLHWMKDPKVVAQARAQRLKQQQEQQTLNAAPGLAQAAKVAHQIQSSPQGQGNGQ